MVVVITETDFGTKEQAKKALDRPFSNPRDWKAIWDDFWYRVERDAHIFCPKDTGALDSTIRVVDAEEVAEIRSAPMFGASGIVRMYEFLDDNRAIVAGDISVINPKTGQPVIYAQAVHDGHFTRTGNWIAPIPFLTEAVDWNLPTLDAEIDRYIEREIKKVYR